MAPGTPVISPEVSAHRKPFLLGPAAAPIFVKGSETTRHVGLPPPLAAQLRGLPASVRGLGRKTLSTAWAGQLTCCQRLLPGAPADLSWAKSPPHFGHQKSTVCIKHGAGSWSRWAEWLRGRTLKPTGRAERAARVPWAGGMGPDVVSAVLGAPDADHPVERRCVLSQVCGELCKSPLVCTKQRILCWPRTGLLNVKCPFLEIRRQKSQSRVQGLSPARMWGKATGCGGRTPSVAQKSWAQTLEFPLSGASATSPAHLEPDALDWKMDWSSEKVQALPVCKGPLSTCPADRR